MAASVKDTGQAMKMIKAKQKSAYTMLQTLYPSMSLDGVQFDCDGKRL